MAPQASWHAKCCPGRASHCFCGVFRAPYCHIENGICATLSLDFVTFMWYIITMKENIRNIINIDHEDSAEPFAVYQHIILKNFWEYYLEEADENGIAFGYVMGFENEWGSVSMDEIKPYIVSIARGKELDYIMPPVGFLWEDEKVLV